MTTEAKILKPEQLRATVDFKEKDIARIYLDKTFDKTRHITVRLVEVGLWEFHPDDGIPLTLKELVYLHKIIKETIEKLNNPKDSK